MLGAVCTRSWDQGLKEFVILNSVSTSLGTFSILLTTEREKEKLSLKNIRKKCIASLYSITKINLTYDLRRGPTK